MVTAQKRPQANHFGPCMQVKAMGGSVHTQFLTRQVQCMPYKKKVEVLCTVKWNKQSDTLTLGDTYA